jgi:hypothetical protein
MAVNPRAIYGYLVVDEAVHREPQLELHDSLQDAQIAEAKIDATGGFARVYTVVDEELDT